MDIKIQPDPEPGRNLLRRSDHYNFMQIGMPSTGFIFGYVPGTPDEAAYREWYAKRYHTPLDDLNQPWVPEAAAKFNDFLNKLVETLATRPSARSGSPAAHLRSKWRRPPGLRGATDPRHFGLTLWSHRLAADPHLGRSKAERKANPEGDAEEIMRGEVRKGAGGEEDADDRTHRGNTQADSIGADHPAAVLGDAARANGGEGKCEADQEENAKDEGRGGFECAADRHLRAHHEGVSRRRAQWPEQGVPSSGGGRDVAFAGRS